MPKSLPKLKLRRGDKKELERIVRSRTLEASLVQRAQIILLASEGYSNNKIATEYGWKAHTIGKWRKRYEASGIEGLKDQPRSGRPTEITEKEKKRIVTKVCSQPPKGLSRWSVRTLARELSLPPTNVHSILKEYDLHPHRIRTFTFSPDVNFEEKLLDVVGVYMTPPEKAIVLCVDEKTGIQALDRTQPMLPLKSKKVKSWTNEYVRHGTRTMLASLNISTGEVTAFVRDNRTSQTFLEFMDHVVKKNKNKRLCVVLDNLNTHTNAAAKQWLEKNPNVTFHYTPKHASWVNLVECFFSIMTKQALQHAVHKSGRQLERFLKEYVKEYNKNCGPFTWTKGPKKLKKIIKLTKEYQKNYMS